MIGKKRIAIIVGVFGLLVMAFGAAISTWAGNDSVQGRAVVKWFLGREIDMDEFFAQLLILGTATGVAILGASLVLYSAMLFFRDELGVEQDWSDWGGDGL